MTDEKLEILLAMHRRAVAETLAAAASANHETERGGWLGDWAEVMQSSLNECRELESEIKLHVKERGNDQLNWRRLMQAL